ncbi:MAG TPA: hypothetical protein VE988_16045 [Gemmataceae bacterium]|nr:hypothetical protein [Gemmataceae bacterium]
MLHKEPKKPDTPAPAEASAPSADDELSRRLREAISRKRPWQRTYFFLLLLALISIFAFVAWWFWQRPQPPELMVIGFDHVTRPGKQFTVRAATVPRQPGVDKWGGRDLFFQEVAPPLAESGQPVALRTGEHGMATATWTLKHPATMAEIEAIYIDDSMRPPWSDRARCRIFTWPSESRLLVLDVDPTMKNSNDWPALAKALAEADSAGWRIVYLAVNANTPADYRPLRDWVIRLQSDLPVGPVLPRTKFPAGEADAVARKKVLAELKGEFSGPVLYMAGEPGLTLRTVGQAGEFMGEPIGLAGWDKLAAALPK